MAKDLIFEIGGEELPAGFVKIGMHLLKESMREELKLRMLSFKELSAFGTPRRLSLAVSELMECQEDIVTSVRGPAKDAAYDNVGAPTKALIGFASSQGVMVAELKVVSTEKGEYVYAEKKIKGKKTEEILKEMLPGVISKLSFPKTMRWGDREITYARPIHWILSVYGGRAVKFDYGHIKSGGYTLGSRFSKNEKIKVDGVLSYIKNLRKSYVCADPDERKKVIVKGLEKEALSAGGMVLKDEALLEEVVNLVEYPVVIKGGFDKEFLDLPKDVVINAMREHQRYFSIKDDKNNLLPYFITIANTPVKNKGIVRKGNERVLRARLNDAKFYFEKDIKTSLKQRIERLKGVVFQSKLGTSYEKAERFTRLSVFIGNKLNYCEPLRSFDKLEWFLTDEYKHFKKDALVYKKCVIARAALLSKADLVSGMVGEFPKLQGIMGREYAKREGEEQDVSNAIYEHYLPTTAGGELPVSETGAIISIADKLDTIAGCFGVGLIPTGAADPYGLRRSALGIIFIILDKGYRMSLDELTNESLRHLNGKLLRPEGGVKKDVLEFFRERLKNQLITQNLSHDSIEAVLSTWWFDIVDSVKRIMALEKFKKHPACPSLVIAFKRVSNILKDAKVAGLPDETLFTDANEKALFEVLKDITPKTDKYWKDGDYEKVFSTLASIKETIDRFFDKVMVMVEDEKIRTNRLKLLHSVRNVYHRIADLSKLAL